MQPLCHGTPQDTYVKSIHLHCIYTFDFACANELCIVSASVAYTYTYIYPYLHILRAGEYLLYILIADLVASEECKEQAIPFLCLYGFPLCSCTHEEIYHPSRDDCERILKTSCWAEFQLASRLDYGDIIPQCNSLLMAYHDKEGTCTCIIVWDQLKMLLAVSCSG